MFYNVAGNLLLKHHSSFLFRRLKMTSELINNIIRTTSDIQWRFMLLPDAYKAVPVTGRGGV
jgi:hypothetical protein